MQRNTYILFMSFTILSSLIIITSSCEKDNNTNYKTTDITTAVFNPNLTYGTVTDFDGNVYKTITIGTQTWMAENLRTTHYQNGNAIPKVVDNDEWQDLTTGAYCNYENYSTAISTYGRLYNWYAVNDNRNIAPVGWHVPTEAEWATLINYLGGEDIAGGKLREIGLEHWTSWNTGDTNESGFTALPGGSRNGSGPYCCKFNQGYWWSNTGISTTVAWGVLINSSSNVVGNGGGKSFGRSVRCILN